MNKLLSLLSSEYDRLGRLVVKAWNGGSYTYTAEEAGPWGMDARAIKGTVGLYAPTQRDGDELFLGWLIKDRLAEIGETRLFSTDANGVQKFNAWLRADGTMLLGDSITPADYANFAVLYNESLAENNKLKATINDLVQRWNAFCNAYTPGSPSTLGTPPTLTASTVTSNASDFTKIKNPKIKYNASNP